MFYFLLRKLIFIENTFTGYAYNECSDENSGFKTREISLQTLWFCNQIITTQFLLAIHLSLSKNHTFCCQT